jgi:hypothetical protein
VLRKQAIRASSPGRKDLMTARMAVKLLLQTHAGMHVSLLGDAVS